MGKKTSFAFTLESLALDSYYLKKSLETYNDSPKNKKACGKPCGKLNIKTEVAEQKAGALIEIFGAPYCRLFFLKCVYHLPEATIIRITKSALQPGIKSPIKYFNYSAKQELRKVGY